jgi:hypothetical protein
MAQKRSDIEMLSAAFIFRPGRRAGKTPETARRALGPGRPRREAAPEDPVRDSELSTPGAPPAFSGLFLFG